MKSISGVMVLLAGLVSATASSSASAACLNLGAYLESFKSLPDGYGVRRTLANLRIESTEDNTEPSALAAQRALNVFDHPNLPVLGLPAIREGGSHQHTFTAYQLDCRKVITGNIFSSSDESQMIQWEIAESTDKSLTLKRASPGGDAEPVSDLKLAVRNFQVLSPTMMAVTSLYLLETEHRCEKEGGGTETSTEKNVVTATELYIAGESATELASLKLPLGAALEALSTKYPRLPADPKTRGEFVTPILPGADPACGAK